MTTYVINPITDELESAQPRQTVGDKFKLQTFVRDRFALGGGVIQGEKVGDRENFADISLGGKKTSALQEKLTSAARNNLDSFVKTWILNNTGDYKATEIDKWKNDLEIAVTEEIAKNSKKYDTGKFKFNKLITTEGGTFPNVQSTRTRGGFEVYDMSYATQKTDRLAPLFNKIFYKGQLLNNKTLKKDVENFMDFIIKNKNYVKGQTQKETARSNIETRKQLSKPEVIAVLDGLNSKQKNEVLGELFKNKYTAFNKKLFQDGLRYKETLKDLEKKVGVKQGSTFQAMTKERLAVQKIIGLEGGLAPSVEHIYGLAVVKDSNDKNLIKSALNAITLKPRQLNVEKGFGATSFDQQRIKLVQEFEKADLNRKNVIRTKLNELSVANDAGLKFTIGKDGSLNTQVTRSSQSVYKRIKNYLTDITKNKQLFDEAMKKGSNQTKQILKDVKKGSYDSLKKLKPQIDKINTTLMKTLGPGTTGRRAAEAVPGVLGKGVDAVVLAPADLFMSLTAGYSIPESVGIAATNFLRGPAAKVIPATLDAYDRQKQFKPVFDLSGGEETKFGKKIREGVGEAIDKIKERFGDDAIGTADEAPEPESSERRRMFEEANERLGNIDEMEISDIDNPFMAAMGGRVGFQDGTPPVIPGNELDYSELQVMMDNPNEYNTFDKGTFIEELDKAVYGTDDEKTLMQKFNRMFLDPRAYPYYVNKAISGAANIPEFAFRTVPALATLGSETVADLAADKYPEGKLQRFGERISPKITEAAKEKVGLTSLIEEGEKNLQFPSTQEYVGDSLEILAEFPGPVTPFVFFRAAPKILRQIQNLGLSATAIEKLNKKLEQQLSTPNQSRRDFLITTGAGGAVAMLKYLGLDKFLGTGTKVAEKAVTSVVKSGGTPQYFFDFVDLIKRKGKDVSDKQAVVERQRVIEYKDYTLTDTDGYVTIRKTDEDMGRDEMMEYKPSEGVVDETTGTAKEVPAQYDEVTARPDPNDPGNFDTDSGFDSIDEVLEELAKDGKKYTVKELEEMGINLGSATKTEMAEGGIIAGVKSGPAPKSGPTPHGLPYLAKNVTPIKERK